MEKKLVIIDYNGMPYRYIYGGAPQLWHNIYNTPVNTTIPAYTIKEIVRLAEFGNCELAVVCDKGKPKDRAERLMKNFGAVYKEGRKSQMPQFYEGIELTVKILEAGGVCVYREDGIEADDIIYNIAKQGEKDGYKVSVFTNDSDLLCLVNDNITIYFRGKKTLGEHKNYVKVTKENFVDVVSELSAMKGYWVPYNSTYLFKLIKGDKTDNLPGYRGYGQNKYNELMGVLDIIGTDFTKCRPDNFDYILETFGKLSFSGTDAGMVEHIIKMHNVMKFDELDISRPQRFDWGSLQAQCSIYGIKLPMEK